MLIAVIILSITTLISSYLAYVHVIKAGKLLQYCEMYVQFIGAIAIRTKRTYDNMKEIDRLGAFQADDETGTTFDELHQNVKDLNHFISKYVNTEDGNKETEEKEN